jgi:methylmalonyl-CoA mutase
MQEAGATAVQEQAFTIDDGVEYVRAATAGARHRRLAGRLLLFAIGMNFFMEVAKLRLARLLWAQLIWQFGPTKPGSMMLRTHRARRRASRSPSTTVQQHRPTAYEAMAAARAMQSPHTNSFDEALAAVGVLGPHRPQHPADPRRGDRHHPRGRPAGGSYYVEALTHSLAKCRSSSTRSRSSAG